MSVRLSLCAIFLFSFAILPLYSHDPITTKLTWTQEVSRVVYKRCATCHRPGGAAFSLLTYEEARPWAKAIRDQVRSRNMPPWGPVKGIGEFANDPSLSEPEIDLLVGWVEGGSPEGDKAYLPAMPPAVKPQPQTTFAHRVAVKSTWKVLTPAIVQGFDCSTVPVGGSEELWVSRKDGAVDRLLWLKHQTTFAPRQYVWREPIELHKGDEVTTTNPIYLLSR